MKKRANVIVFLTDQQRWDSSALYGNPLNLTPNFDRMAMNGTHFYNGFSCQPVCGPARACIQTGKYATTVGTFVNGIPLPEKEKTLGYYFKNVGYETAYIGKWHLAGNEFGPVPQQMRNGYDYWLASNVLEFTSSPYKTTMYNNENQPVNLIGYRVDAVVDAAISYINKNQKSPFFLFVSPIEPHMQNQIDDFPPPEGYREKYTSKWIPADLAALGGSTHQHLGGYWGMIKRIDEAFGRMLDALRSLDLLENTIVVYTSDHGCHFKTRNSEYKRSCHESSIHVPMAIQGPGFDGKGRVKNLISLLDISPTILDAVGIKVPSDMQGCSVMPLLKNQQEYRPDEVLIQISESQVGRAIRTQRWKYYIADVDKDPIKQMESDRYEEQLLYDLKYDPHELCNLISYDSHNKVKESLKIQLVKKMIEAGEKAPAIISARTKVDSQRNHWHFEMQ